MTRRKKGTVGQEVMLAMLQTLFLGWHIEIDRGVWVARGTVHIRATTVDSLIEALFVADPDAVYEAAAIFTPG